MNAQQIFGIVRLIALTAFLWFISTHQARANETAIETIIGECASCSEREMQVIGEVIRNRAKVRNQSIEAVCLAKWQFSCQNDKARLRKFIKNQPDLVRVRAERAWQASAKSSIVGRADHYFADYIRVPKWARSMRFVGKVGSHLFYQSKGGR